MIDRLAQLVSDLRLINTNLSDQDLEHVIETLQQAAIELDAVPHKRFPKRLIKKGPPVKWICCKPPTKHRTRKGKYVWMSWCKWKKGGKTGGMMRVLGDARKPKPTKPLGLRTC